MKLMSLIRKSILILMCLSCIHSHAAPVRVTGADIQDHVINIPEGYHLKIVYLLRYENGLWQWGIHYLEGQFNFDGVTAEITGNRIEGIRGPSTLTLINSNNYIKALEYEIVSNDLSSASEVKYTSSLSSDGNRLAIAQQDGTNSITRVYEFDGSSWNQLGADVQ